MNVEPVAWERFRPIIIIKNNTSLVVTREDFLEIKKTYEQKHIKKCEPLCADVWKDMNFYIFNNIVEMVLHDNLHKESMEGLQNYYNIDPHKFIWYICLDIHLFIRDQLIEYFDNPQYALKMKKRMKEYEKNYLH